MTEVATDLLGQLRLFFTRVEAKSSVILGVNTGMIWFVAANRFLMDFTKQTREELALDLLGQVWQNSQILTSKVDSLSSTYSLCALAVLPWGLAMVVFVSR